MTTAPPNLLAVRSLLMPVLNLSAVEMGIVGDDHHDGGYHCGRSGVTTSDYSVRESARDKSGLTDWASALDVGYFKLSVRGKAHDLRSFSIWLVAQCKAGKPDTADIREVIYSPDGKTVKRWDRLGKRTGGDSSHLHHTHTSFFRDATKANRALTPVYRRYLTEIGLIDPTTLEDFMAGLTEAEQREMHTALCGKSAGVATLPRLWAELLDGVGGKGIGTVLGQIAAVRAQLGAVADPVDEQAIVAGVLAGLGSTDLDTAAAALRAAFGDRAAELGAKLATPAS
jgi:hypothetical protein